MGFEDPPSGGFWQKWFGGALVPILAAWYGIACIVTQDAMFRGGWAVGSSGEIRLLGLNACLYGAAVLAIGLFAHFHYFWGQAPRLSDYSAAGKITVLLMFIAAVVALCVRVGVLG